MKKRLLLFILALCMVAGCCVKLSSDSSARVVEGAMSSTVALVVQRGDSDDDWRTYCTGVWVANDTIITADHCAKAVAENAMSEIATSEEELRELVEAVEVGLPISFIVDGEATGIDKAPLNVHVAKVVKFDYDHDLAMLVIDDTRGIPVHSVAPVAARTPSVGSELHIVGQTKGLYWTYMHGYVAAYREKDFAEPFKVGPWLQVSAPVWYGNSGGGAFNEYGELVGIASFIMPRAPSIGFFVHVDTIRKFLQF